MAYEVHNPSTFGEGPPLLLLHGLAGHQGEWDDLRALLLSDGHRVITYDARGHGGSTRSPRDMSRAANVRDAVTVIRELALAPVVLVGQSLGGLTALLTAAAHPDLVGSLVLVEAGPGGPSPNLPSDIGSWLDRCPTPLSVDRDRMIAAVEELATHDYWAEWSRVLCPTLVVRGGTGTMPEQEPGEMRRRRPGKETVTVTVPGAGHDVHLDQPGRLYDAMNRLSGSSGLGSSFG
ncbi:alpha/beta fold hydrolase [Streptomyces sp. NPDC020898]|uniref:alpha/beta fold hydrolase n=1 Tax=Streptomyces sp. NPDC020898 TaxID=3365101 RepID=UPI0037B5B5D9